MTVSATPGSGGPSTRNEPGPAVPGPSADCTADSAGGLSFDIALPAGGPGWDAVVLQLRGGDSLTDAVSLPLVPSGEGRLRAVLPSTVELPEGRWDVYVTVGDGAPRRLRPGVNDLRSLVDRTPRADRTWLGVRIPYATKYGNLSLRAWLRWPHAEAGEIRIADGGITLHGQLHGAELGPTARLEAHARSGPAVVSAPVAPHGRCFAAPLPCEKLAAHRTEGEDSAVWDLWLRPSESEPPVRIARILDDIPDKSQILRYPSLELPQAGVTPVYTGDNNLAVRLKRPG